MEDGKVLIGTKMDTSGISDGVDSTEEKLKGLGDSTKKTTDEVGNLWAKLFKADFFSDIASSALQKLGEVVLEIAKGSIEASAEVTAANAQFSQTFKDMEKEATKSLESISKETGVAATRMQGSYTKVYAFTKSVGSESAEAMDIANRAMLAAADSAAYYDTTIEEATETLQSFLKGNYENDAALGIAATETTRNAKANELYATSFDKLSEAQKVDVLLAMVEAGNAASGALGQAARESDAWANVIGEAEEAMRQFQAVIGEPVIEMLTPIIQKATAAIYEMIEATDADKLADNMEDITKSWEDAEKQFVSTTRKVEASAVVAKSYADKLTQLEKTGLTTADSQKEYANAVAALNDLMPGLNLQISEQTGLVNLNTDAILTEIDALRQKALHQAAMERYNAVLQAQADAQLAVAEAEYALSEIQKERAVINEQLAQSTGLSADELSRMYTALMSENYMLQTNSALTISAADGAKTLGSATRELTQEETKWLKQSTALTAEETILNDELKKVKESVEKYNKQLKQLDGMLGTVEGATGDFSDAQGQLTESVEVTIATAQSLQEEYESAKESARNSVDSQIGYFDELSTESSKSAAEIVANWGKQQQAFQNYSANLEKAVDMGLDEALVKQLADGSTESMAILDGFVNATDLSVDEINAAFRKMSESRDEVSDVMADIASDADEQLGKMIEDAAAAGPEVTKALADGINANSSAVIRAMSALGASAAAAFQRALNSGTSVNVTGGGGGTIGGGNTSVSPFSLRMANMETSIPYLASGAVIPPNAPFMAVLGDQRHGTNVEAPLSTIQEAVRAELSDLVPAVLSGFEALIAEQQATRQAIESIEVGDTTIGEAVGRYNRKISTIKGGG